MNIVGIIKFDNRNVCVYEDVNAPLFKLNDVASMLNYSGGLKELINICEEDEVIYKTTGDNTCCFINERGLYNVLSQLRDSTSRKWRRVVLNNLTELRKSRNMSIMEQFEEWDHELDNIYYDDVSGKLMCSVTIENGDVAQVPYEG